MEPKIFISYSSKDKKVAQAVCEALEKQGLGCWIAPRNITPGVKYAEAILDGIENSEIFIVILSTSSNESPEVGMEVDRAASKDKTIITFRYEDVKLSKSFEYYLSNRHWLEATDKSLDEALLELVDTVNKLTVQGSESTKNISKDKTPIQKKDTPEEKKKTEKKVMPPATIPLNPFTYGNPVKDPSRFYGRDNEIRQITNRLLSSAHESTSVIGERRIGKTSLLSHLSNPEVAAGFGLSPERFCLVYVDFQGLTDITPHRFWQRIFTKMARSICDQSLVPIIKDLAKQGEYDLFDLEDLFEEVSGRGMTTVLFMDEFEYVTQNPNFGSDFFGGLRALAIHHGVTLVPSTRRELVDLCHSDEIKGSPFFNIFANVVLKPFLMEDAATLVDGYLASIDLPFSEQERDFILHAGGGQPLFLQIAGYFLVDLKLQGLEGKELIKKAMCAFDEQADPHFDYYWTHCSNNEKITILSIMALGQQKPSKKTITNIENLKKMNPRANMDVAALSKRGILVEEDGAFSLFSPSLERWIAYEVSAPPGEEESEASVEEWLRGGGRESLSPVKGTLPKFKKQYWPIISNILTEVSYEVLGSMLLNLPGKLIG